MAEFHDVGAYCSEPSCGRQDFLPFTCDGCSRQFCEEHFRPEAHCCPQIAAQQQFCKPVSAGASTEPALRCPAKGCREVLSAHNTFHCQRCCQDVCIKHRFEDDHQCITVEAAVGAALRRAEQEMPAAKFAEAHRTFLKVFGNILSDPNNEKFRMLKKSNAAVQEKLQHPACIEILRLCGFYDMGEVYVCRQAADLAHMRGMSKLLRLKQPAGGAPSAAAPSQASKAASSGSGGGGGGVRLVNGVIVREQRPADDAAAPPPARAPPASLSRPAAAAAAAAGSLSPAASSPSPMVGPGSGGRPPASPSPSPVAAGVSAPASSPSPVVRPTASRPKSAFDFESRGERERREQAQQDALQDLRRQQKERYKAGGAPTGSSATAAQPQPGGQDQRPSPQQQQQQQQQQEGCTVQ